MIVIIYVIKSYSLHDATRKETSNISAQDKVGNFFTIIKCHSLQNRPTIFFIFQVNGGKRQAWAKGGAFFFFGLLPSHVSRLRFASCLLQFAWKRSVIKLCSSRLADRMTDVVACIDGQSARKHYAAIIERNYLEIQPNITLLLPLSERDKIGNRNTTNRKPNFF